jgi:hypothetical protein
VSKFRDPSPLGPKKKFFDGTGELRPYWNLLNIKVQTNTSPSSRDKKKSKIK